MGVHRVLDVARESQLAALVLLARAQQPDAAQDDAHGRNHKEEALDPFAPHHPVEPAGEKREEKDEDS